MIVLPPAVLALFDEGRLSIRGMIRFDFGSGSYGFIRALGPLTWNGLAYQPGGLISVSDLAATMGGSAQAFAVTLAASPDDGLTPAILQGIEAVEYRDRPVTIYDAYFHPDTGALLHVQPLRRGYVDTIRHETTPDDGYRLIADCETRALDYTRRNGRRRTSVDQARRAPGDKFFEHCAKRGREEIYWGRERTVSPLPTVAASRGFKAGITNR